MELISNTWNYFITVVYIHTLDLHKLEANTLELPEIRNYDVL